MVVAKPTSLWKTSWKDPKTGPIGPPAQYFPVAQDHFDGTNNAQWNQAYFVNDTYWSKRPDAPVFLCVGGEGPALDGSAVVASPHCNVAVEWLQETGALMFAVEHRYYGCHNLSACPVGDPRAPGALRFLSSRQALSDLVAFHKFASAKYGLTGANKWVSWGGSYPGMLASWTRTHFPHLFFAAVASSAPVRAQFDMFGYNDLLANAFTVSNNGVGGSEECRARIASGHAAIGASLATPQGRASLAQLFKLPSADWLLDVENQRSFAGYGVAVFDAQSNDPSCADPSCNIAQICKVMTQQSSLSNVERLAQVRAEQNLSMEPHTAGAKEEVDFWFYQTCTEFAFYQSCDEGSSCFFTQGLVTAATEERGCAQYGLSPQQVERNVEDSNLWYGADQPAGTRVFYVNGEVDPWRALSITNSSGLDCPTYYVKGASHHAWTHPSAPSDQESVVTARAVIRNQVAQWLGI